jgi:hypothetical protein
MDEGRNREVLLEKKMKGKEKVAKRGWKEDVGMGWKSVSVRL